MATDFWDEEDLSEGQIMNYSTVSQETPSEVCVVPQEFRPLPGHRQASHVGVQVPILAALLIQLPADAPGRAVEDDPSVWTPALTC